MPGTGPTLHDTVGPAFFVDLVDRFYDSVEGDPVLISLYPDGADTAAARERLAMFLAQYWGGPHEYTEKRGHPMLRARHNQWVIGPQERDRWLLHMLAALEQSVAALALDQAVKDDVLGQVATYMVNAAGHLRNAD
ncbi:MAG: globin [Actinomycetota bacterium]